MRRFINGKLEGTRLEIMPSPAASALPDGTPISVTVGPVGGARLNETQQAHLRGELDVHARQRYTITSELASGPDGEYYEDIYALGPTIAQQWKNEYNAKLTQRGWRARY